MVWPPFPAKRGLSALQTSNRKRRGTLKSSTSHRCLLNVLARDTDATRVIDIVNFHLYWDVRQQGTEMSGFSWRNALPR